jgi:hypothetical protein
MGFDSADGPKNSRFPYDRLVACVTIGFDDGDPLFIDASDDHSIWLLHHDSESGHVQPIATSLSEWLEKAKPVQEDLDFFNQP